MKITLLMAQTVDGKVARTSDEFTGWTSKEDKKIFVAETKRAGVVIMGRKTFDTIGKPLPGRRIVVMTRRPPHPSPLPPGERVISPPLMGGDQGEGGVVEYTNDPPKLILKKLEAQGYSEVIVAGGPTINALFLKDGLVNEIKLTVEPKLFGQGLSLAEGEPLDLNLELIECKNLTPSVLFLHYRLGPKNLRT